MAEIGTGTCKLCHRISHKSLIHGYERSAHSESMGTIDSDVKIVADFGKNKTFRRKDAAYVIGKGLRKQAFLTSSYRVLPAVWDSSTRKWRPFPPLDAKTQCLGCHTTCYTPAGSHYRETSVGCQACHGPGHRHFTHTELIVNPAKLSVGRQTMVCGQCHSSGKDRGGKFAFPVGYTPGKDLRPLARAPKSVCPDRTDQYTCFVSSKHHAAGVTCITCHDPHGQTDEAYQLKKPANRLCIDCHAPGGKAAKRICPQKNKNCVTCHMPDGKHTFGIPARRR